ncbi:uncharacterized protein METZ01_LOCUS485146, partial [marine metagenome]
IVSLNNLTLGNDTIIYSVTVTNGNSCIDSSNVIVVVNFVPESDAGNDTSFCSADSATIGSASTPGYDYSWNTADGLSDSTLANPTVSWINNDTITDTLIYIVTTTVDSCSTSDSVTVIVFPLPIVDAGEDTSICSGLPLGIGTSAIPNHVYNWSPGVGLNDSTVSNPLATLYNTGSLPDTISYFLHETDTITSCSFSDTIQLIIWPNPDTTEIFGSVSICPGADSISYWLTENNGSAYSW